MICVNIAKAGYFFIGLKYFTVSREWAGRSLLCFNNTGKCSMLALKCTLINLRLVELENWERSFVLVVSSAQFVKCRSHFISAG